MVQIIEQSTCVLTGTNLEDEDVLAKSVKDIDGRTVGFLNSCWCHTHVPRMVGCIAGITAQSALTIPLSYLGVILLLAWDASHMCPSLHVVMQLYDTGVHVQYYEYESYAPYGTNGSHQISRATTKVITHAPMLCGLILCGELGPTD